VVRSAVVACSALTVTAIDAMAADPGRCSRRRGCLTTLLAALLLVTAGCAEEALPERRLTIDDCLTNVEIDHLEPALQRCNQVVAAFPREPQPLNERFLLHSLRGEEQAACRDIRRAHQLAERIPPRQLDPLLRQQLALRLASCREQPATTAGSAAHTRSRRLPADPATAAGQPGG
jgi:hypothetical protein